MSGEAFGVSIDPDQQPTPQDLDLDAWIAQGARAHRTVPVCINAQLLIEREELVQRIDQALAKAEQNKDAETALADEPELLALEREWEDMQARIDAASRPFTVKALNGRELRQTHDAAKAAGVDGKDVNTLSLWMIAAASVEPAMTVQQVEALYDACGDAGIHQLAGAVQELMVAGRATPSAPFSRKPSQGSPTS